MTWCLWRWWRLAWVHKGMPCPAGARVGDARGMWRPLAWRFWWLQWPAPLPHKGHA